MSPWGGFQLGDFLDAGGVCEVYSGQLTRPDGTSLPVALKTLRSDLGRKSSLLRAFRKEARALAGLQHPSIVRLFEYGALPESVEGESQGKLVAGAPYVLMELANGSLLGLVQQLSWPQLYRILLALLDGLAHAHARGVLHRDLKPGNVLVFERGVKLTDFGLVHVLEPTLIPEDAQTVRGTLHYMPPEQITRSWRDYGPWTDLYGLGATTYAMLSGAPPFGSIEDAGSLFLTRLSQETPALELGPGFPVGLWEWLQSLLAIDPGQRYQRAADAAWALQELHRQWRERGGEVQAAQPEAGSTPAMARHQTPAMATLTHLLSSHTESGPVQRTEWSPLPSVPAQHLAPPLPLDWRQDEAPPEAGDLGLGLFALRTPPVVGREAERDELWQALRSVWLRKTPQVMVLEGPSGSGKSRLAQWLCERAHEVGAASIWRATHSPQPGPFDGLGAMTARSLTCHGMDPDELTRRLQSSLDLPLDQDLGAWKALVRWLSHLHTPPPEPSFRSDIERYATLYLLLQKRCTSRMAILWLDDVHWDLDSLAFAAYLATRHAQQSLPVLVLLTLDPKTLLEREATRRQLAQLQAEPTCRSLSLGPLSAEEHRELLRHLLPLEPGLRQRLLASPPILATQLLGQWIQQGALVPGPEGFGLKADIDGLPQDLQAVWEARIAHLQHEHGPQVQEALETAAVYGQDVDALLWEWLCRSLKLAHPISLLEDLLEGGLARCHEEEQALGSWYFAHSSLRESLLEQAQQSGRWSEYHRRCAGFLEQRGGAAERRAHHLLQAGEQEAATGPLLEAIDEQLKAGRLSHAEELFAQWLELLDAQQLPPSHPHRGQAGLIQLRLFQGKGDFGQGMEQAEQLLQRAYALPQWERILTEALQERAFCGWQCGHDEEEVWRWYREAEQQAHSFADPELLARCFLYTGSFLALTGQSPQARSYLEFADEEFAKLGEELEQARCQFMLARIAYIGGENAEAQRQIQQIMATFERAGALKDAARCLSALGDLARVQGELSQSESLYRRCLSRYDALGLHGHASICRLNLGLVQLARHQLSQARQIFEQVQSELAQGEWLHIQAFAHLFCLPVLAIQGDWEAWDLHLTRGQILLEETASCEVDVAQVTALAGLYAQRAHQPQRAQQAYAIAHQQWQRLGRFDEAQRILVLLEAIQ